MSVPKTHAFLLVFSLDNPASLGNVKKVLQRCSCWGSRCQCSRGQCSCSRRTCGSCIVVGAVVVGAAVVGAAVFGTAVFGVAVVAEAVICVGLGRRTESCF